MKNLFVNFYLFLFLTLNVHAQNVSLSPITLNGLSEGAVINRTALLEGFCSIGSELVLNGFFQDGSQNYRLTCADGSFQQEIVFQNLGAQEVSLTQQINSNLSLNYHINLIVLEDIDTTPPNLALVSPARGDALSRTATIRGTCEVGIIVNYLAGGTYGSFDCMSENFVQEFVFPEVGQYNFYLRQVDEAGNTTTTRTNIRVLEDVVVVPEVPDDEDVVVVPEVPDDENEDGSNNENSSSNGSIAINGIRASRLECTSPCPIIFSLDRMTDTSSTNPFISSGINWDYGDDQADEVYGRFEKGSEFFRGNRLAGTGSSRESDTNTPIGMHTYHCEEGTCTFNPGVAVRNNNGDWATEWLTVVVQAQETQFVASQTVCISQSGNYGGEQACPEGAQWMTYVPGPNEWRSNTRYLLRRGERFTSSCLAYDLSNIVIDDFGNSADTSPAIDTFGIGHDGNCNDTIPNDQRIANYSLRNWIENITLNDLRIAHINVGMTFKDLTFNNLDMDFENQPSGGEIQVRSADACSNHADLTCSSIPLPQGVYISGTSIIGSRQGLPGVNVSLMSSTCVSFFGVIDTEIETAYEHNIRLECASRVIAIHSDLNGNHMGANGNKHAMTIRPDGYLNEDMLGRNKIDTSNAKSAVYDNRYIVAKNLYLGSPNSANNSARVTFTASNGGLPETTRYGLVSNNVSDMLGGTGSGPSSRDVSLQGIGLACYSDNYWTPGFQGCRDHGQRAVPTGFYEEAITDMAPPEAARSPASYSE
ncbi:MAG: hypothetical protein ACJASL_003165 [Paraglaciecola sp.]